MIEIRDVRKSYGQFRALDGCTTSVAKGSVIVVCGPSGSGKSTLIRCVNGLEPVDSGTIVVDGVVVTAPNTNLVTLRMRIGMVFQSFELFPHRTVLDNLNLAQIEVLRRTKPAATERSMALLARVGLTDQAPKFPAALSGGQQQRVAIARALAMDPVAMLFDEPTSALDPEMITEVLDVMVGLADEGMTMMVVTHEMAFARRVADRILFMDAGRIVEDRETNAFFTEPHTERAREFLSKILHHADHGAV
jgi:glutamate/aspartate transport system ATP-binding protein